MRLRDLKLWHAAILLALLFIGAEMRQWPLRFAYDHPDEIIATEVARHVIESGSADTNWKNAGLPPHFKVPQYNFSGYLLSAAGVTALADAADAGRSERLVLLRRYSAWLGVLVLALTFALGWRLGGPATGVLAAALALANPLLAQDSLYARPENFLTVLTLLFLLLLGSSLPRLAAAAFIGGIMLGTKITSAALLPLLLLPEARAFSAATLGRALVQYATDAARALPRRLPVAAAGVFAGFATAAPYALVNPADFAAGILALVTQYATGHWPYGIGEGALVARAAYAARYFVATDGWPLFVLAGAGLVFCVRDKNVRGLAIVAVTAGVALRFATYGAFFERNFSNLIPVLLVFAAFGAERLARTLPLAPLPLALAAPHAATARASFAVALTALAAVQGAFITRTILTEEVNGRGKRELARLRGELAQAYGLAVTPFGWDPYYQGLTARAVDLCRPMLVEIPYVEERQSFARLRETISNYGLLDVGRYRSKFAGVPFSTLHAYFTPETLFLYRNAVPRECAKREALVAARSVGAALAVAGVAAEAAWTKSGDYPEPARADDPRDYFASWSGADANTGALRMTVVADGRAAVVLPFRTGPVPRHQSIRISDAAGGAVIWTMSPLPVSETWSYLRIPLPPHVERLVIEAVDAGAGWGEWHGLAPPREFTR